MKASDVLHSNLMLSVFLYFIALSNSYVFLHTPTHYIADSHPLRISLITILLLLLITLKIQATKKRKKVMKIVKYLENLPDS